MTSFLKKYKVTLLFIYITLWTALASTPMNEVFHFPKIAAQIFSLLLYLPFFGIIVWKLISDLRGFRLYAANIAYYAFALYYAVLSAVRLLNGVNVKESIYYSVVLLGSVALCLLILDGKLKLSQPEYTKNLIAIGWYTVLIKLLFVFLEGNFFSLAPVNNLYSTSILVMLLPFMVFGFRKKTDKRALLSWGAFWLSVMLILVCSSRAITLLAFAVLGVLFFFTIDKQFSWLRFLSGILAAVMLVALLAVCNVGLVRRSLYRGFGIRFGSSSNTEVGVPSDGIEDNYEMQVNVDSQIDRSDSMRSDLQKIGISEFRKNPLFGTGDLYYTYDMGYKTMEQTAHNFILESLVCYGITGTVMILILYALLLHAIGFFRFRDRAGWPSRLCLILVAFHYLALGMVQPSVFNTLLCPLFICLLAYYGQLLSPQPKACPTISLMKGRKDVPHGSEE